MPKHKRSKSKDNDYNRMLKKVKKLKRKLKKKCRESSLSVRSNSTRSGCDSDYTDKDIHDQVINLEDDTSYEERPAYPEPMPTPVTPAPPPAPTPPPEGANAQELSNAENLDPDILELLGEDPSTKKKFGGLLHKDIVPRWTYILTNGLAKDVQAELVKQYLPPENCAIMSAPKLNAEVTAALSDLNLKQDIYSQGKQNQMGSGLAALAQVLNWALTSKDIVPADIIKALSDAGRLFCDSFHRESLSRRYAVLNALNKNIKETIKDTKIDENLFGSNLADHLRTSKAICKTASEMKPNRTRAPPMTQSQRGALNLRGTPRAPAAEPRTAPAHRRPPPQPPQRDRRQHAPRDRQRATGYPRHQTKC